VTAMTENRVIPEVIEVSDSTSDKASMTIYFCLIKYHQDLVLEVMSKKASFLKKLLKNI
jgi:hypothetical protein